MVKAVGQLDGPGFGAAAANGGATGGGPLAYFHERDGASDGPDEEPEA